jgi:hypothetical protein
MLNYPNGVEPKDFDEKEKDDELMDVCWTCQREALFLDEGNCKNCVEKIRENAVEEIEKCLKRALELQSKGCHFVAKGQVESALKILTETWGL